MPFATDVVAYGVEESGSGSTRTIHLPGDDASTRGAAYFYQSRYQAPSSGLPENPLTMSGILPINPVTTEQSIIAAALPAVGYYAWDRLYVGATLPLVSYAVVAALLYIMPASVRATIRSYLPSMLVTWGIGGGALIAAAAYAYFHGVGQGLDSTASLMVIAAGLGVYAVATMALPEVEKYAPGN